MLNNFYFHLYAQKSLFIGENANVFLGDLLPHNHILSPLKQGTKKELPFSTKTSDF